jgi:putative tricarboxylic transport membrane protein
MSFYQRMVGAVAAGSMVLFAAQAQADTVDVMIGGGPGGGWDTTARQAMGAMSKAGIITDGVNFTNKGGAAGTIALAEFINKYQGKDNALTFMGVIMVGGIILNNSPVSVDQTTPLARLTNEYLVIAVTPDSPLKTIADFAAALKADPGAVAVGGGSAGGVDHVLLGLIAKDQGVDVAKINYIPQTSGAETVTGVIGGSLAAGISGYSEFKTFVESGRLKILAVSSDERLAGVDAPTLKESGINVGLGNWRGVLGAPDMPAEGREKWLANFAKLHDSAEWKEVLKTQGWEDAYMSGDEFVAFVKSEQDTQAAVLKDLGLAK